MSVQWGMQAQAGMVLLMVVTPGILLTGCEYGGSGELPVQASAQAATPPSQGFDENLDQIARRLDVSATDPGLPSEAGVGGEMSADLAPGDYLIMAACAGVDGAMLTVTRGEDVSESADVKCGPRFEQFIRHPGGRITISAVPGPGRTESAAGVALKVNDNPKAAELEDMREWSAQKLKPAMPGQIAGSTSSNSSTGYGFQAEPGTYELQLVCEGASGAEVSMVTWSNSKILIPQAVQCNGDVFTATVDLPTKGADLRMEPVDGDMDTRYAFRLIPAK